MAQGGYWGTFITEQMGVLARPELLGIHVNLPSAVPAAILMAAGSGDGPPPGLLADEKPAFERLAFFFAHGLPIFSMMANHPQALYAIADSPVGLAAWFLEHDLRSYELIARAFDGQREGLSRDDVLDNLTLTWLTNTAVSSSRLYRESKLPFFVPMGVAIPTTVSAFPDEIFQCPRSWAEQAYPKLIRYNKLDKGGHFAAWEQPKLISEELRAIQNTSHRVGM